MTVVPRSMVMPSRCAPAVPPWCTEDRHFAGDEVIYADHGYDHYGTETKVPTPYKFPGMTDGPQTIGCVTPARVQPPIPARRCRSASMAAACALPWPPEPAGELAASASFVPTRVPSAVLIFVAATLSGRPTRPRCCRAQRERPAKA